MMTADPHERGKFTNLMFASDDGARLHLCSYLDRLGVRALYCDMDSVLFVRTKDIPTLVDTGEISVL